MTKQITRYPNGSSIFPLVKYISTYYYITVNQEENGCKVMIGESTWNDNVDDYLHLVLQNVFTTEAECQQAIDKLPITFFNNIIDEL